MLASERSSPPPQRRAHAWPTRQRICSQTMALFPNSRLPVLIYRAAIKAGGQPTAATFE